jgi:hypothetical protein
MFAIDGASIGRRIAIAIIITAAINQRHHHDRWRPINENNRSAAERAVFSLRNISPSARPSIREFDSWRAD